MRRFVLHFIPVDNRDGSGVEVRYIPLEISDAQIFALHDGPGDEAIRDELETLFGTHDYCADGTEEVLGYMTSEVATARRAALMDRWKDWLAAQGWAPGAVVILSGKGYSEHFGIPSPVG